jgi:hypothetical protein
LSVSAASIPAQSVARLHGGWRTVGRVASIITAGVALALVAAAIPAQLAAPGAMCSTAHSCVSGQLSPEAASTLVRHGISLQAFAIFSTAAAVWSALVWFAAAAIVLVRRADDHVALLMGLQAFTQGASTAANTITDPHSIWFFLASAIGVVNPVLLFYVFALFPNGYFVPRWMRWVAIIWIAVQPLGLLPGWDGLLLPLFLTTTVLLVGSQIYRYRRVSDPIQRQQTKICVFAFAAMITIISGVLLPGLVTPALLEGGSLYTIVASIINTHALLLGPVALVIAVLRYRLFDIDVIINRTLVYGSLTILLAAVYVGSVIGLQQLAALAGLHASENPPIMVLSTLLIVALVQPLRRRIQSGIDRRFYRAKYDAARTLASFATMLRSEVELEQLREQVLAVAQETMQPAQVSLWLRRLRPKEGGATRTAHSQLQG